MRGLGRRGLDAPSAPAARRAMANRLTPEECRSSPCAARSASASTRQRIAGLAVGESAVVRWHPIDLPIPPGWIDAGARAGHHMRWSRLLESARLRIGTDDRPRRPS